MTYCRALLNMGQGTIYIDAKNQEKVEQFVQNVIKYLVKAGGTFRL
jgi:hypothetical protein